MSLEILPQPHRDVRSSAEKQMDELKQITFRLEILSAQTKLNISEKEKEIHQLRKELAGLSQGWTPASQQPFEAQKKLELELAESDLSFLKGTLDGFREDIRNVSLEMMKLIGK